MPQVNDHKTSFIPAGTFVNFEHISHLDQVFLFLTLSRLIPAGITLSMFKVNCPLMLFSSQHVTFHPITPSVHKMVRRTLKIL